MEFIQLKENDRLGLDYRYDGLFGLWIESSHIKSSNKMSPLDSIIFSTLGIDYTLNIWNGVYLMLESMSYEFKATDNSVFHGRLSSLMIQYPIGILYDLSLIRIYDNKLNESSKAIIAYEKLLLEYNSSIYAAEARKRYRVLRGDNQIIDK